MPPPMQRNAVAVRQPEDADKVERLFGEHILIGDREAAILDSEIRLAGEHRPRAAESGP